MQTYYPSRPTLWTRLKLHWEKVKYRLKDKDTDDSALVPETLYTNTHNKLDQAVADVFNAKYGDDNYGLQQTLRKNVSLFSAHKSAWYSEWIKGRTIEEREAVIDVYLRQLDVESNMASRASRSAKQWQGFEKTKAQYPNLEYLPSRSTDKRHNHTQYYGTVLPINHAFWNTAMPPNGWNCKCRVRPSDADTTNAKIPPKPIKGIAGNAGKEKVIFTDTHPFFRNVNEKGKDKILKEWRKLERKRVKVWAKANLKDKVFKKGKHDIHLNTKGIKEIINQNHDHYWEKNQLLFDIEMVLKKAELIGLAPYTKPSTVFVKVYYYEFELTGKLSYLNVLEKVDGKLFLYSITDTVTVKRGHQ